MEHLRRTLQCVVPATVPAVVSRLVYLCCGSKIRIATLLSIYNKYHRGQTFGSNFLYNALDALELFFVDGSYRHKADVVAAAQGIGVAYISCLILLSFLLFSICPTSVIYLLLLTKDRHFTPSMSSLPRRRSLPSFCPRRMEDFLVMCTVRFGCVLRGIIPGAVEKRTLM